MKAREARKNQVNTVIKEMKLRPKIDPHDYETKKGHVVRFLKQGDKVKITIMFRGREQSRPELGYRLLQRLAADVEELGFVESAPKQDGRNMIMVLGPHKKKAEARWPRPRRQTGRRDDAAPSGCDADTDADATASRTARGAPRPAPRPRPPSDGRPDRTTAPSRPATDRAPAAARPRRPRHEENGAMPKRRRTAAPRSASA